MSEDRSRRLRELPRYRHIKDSEYPDGIPDVAGEWVRHADVEAALLRAGEASPSNAVLVTAVKGMLGAYSREIAARTMWAQKPEPWSPESRAMFDTVLTREAETRDAALHLGALVYLEESSLLADRTRVQPPEHFESGNCPHCGAWVNFAQEAEIERRRHED